MLRRWCISLAVLAVATAPALTALATASSSASAATARPAVATAHVTVSHGTLRNGGVAVHLGKPGSTAFNGHGGIAHEEESTNWSGYAADSGTYTSVSAEWVQPKGTCSGSGDKYSSFWVGLDGYSSDSVEQTGTDTDCDGSTPEYYGWYEMYPNPSYNFGSSISPGDTIKASVSYGGSNKYTLSLSDVTKGWTSTTTKTLSGAPRSSAEVIIEAPSSDSGVLPLADFGTVNVSDSLVNGAAIGTTDPAEIIMINNSGQDKDTVSALSSNENFSATWVRSS
ncbi:MAG TPA: G1 family glutamic endopeptidase [Streptosporangiaceae bacterium]|nr:G1 family glutamic endopeptidase [Streptosporangiaceae bacterium]